MISTPAIGLWPRMLIYVGKACPKFNPTAWHHPSLQPHACEAMEGFSFIYAQQYLLSIYYVPGNLPLKN